MDFFSSVFNFQIQFVSIYTRFGVSIHEATNIFNHSVFWLNEEHVLKNDVGHLIGEKIMQITVFLFISFALQSFQHLLNYFWKVIFIYQTTNSNVIRKYLVLFRIFTSFYLLGSNYNFLVIRTFYIKIVVIYKRHRFFRIIISRELLIILLVKSISQQ